MFVRGDTETGPRLAQPTGLAGIEVLVIIGVVAFCVLCILLTLPKGRESARLTGCQHNLKQIGMAVLHYEQVQRHYPVIAPLDQPGIGTSPIDAMLQAFVIPDFLDFRDRDHAPKATEAPNLRAKVAGLTCPSDSQASLGVASINYRANTGDDFAGMTGPFAPGTTSRAGAVEAGDGLSHTAGYSERLIGTGRDDEPWPMNYAIVTGPIQAPCDPTQVSGGRWKGGAGDSWGELGWRSTLYSHVVPPNSVTSCIAEDGRTATMTASSPHPGRINVWMLDGSLRGVTPSVHPPIWRAMGSFGSSPPDAKPGS